MRCRLYFRDFVPQCGSKSYAISRDYAANQVWRAWNISGRVLVKYLRLNKKLFIIDGKRISLIKMKYHYGQVVNGSLANGDLSELRTYFRSV